MYKKFNKFSLKTVCISFDPLLFTVKGPLLPVSRTMEHRIGNCTSGRNISFWLMVGKDCLPK